MVAGGLAAGSVAIGAPQGPSDGGSISASDVARADGTPTLPPGTTTPTTTTGTIPTVPPKIPRVTATQVIKLPSSKKCIRRLRIALTTPSGVKLSTLSINAGARKIRRKRTPTAITLGQLPTNSFTLRVSVKTNGGQSLVRTRRFRPCA